MTLTNCKLTVSFLLSFFRSFGGSPSLNSGQENAKVLREALIKAGKTFDPHTSIGAAYDSYFSLTHHNEIWIYAA